MCRLREQVEEIDRRAKRRGRGARDEDAVVRNLTCRVQLLAEHQKSSENSWTGVL